MTLRLHNTLTKQVDDFRPITDGKVTLYTCGPTVYNYLHVGNWAAYIYWDTLVRALQIHGYDVERVMNITDVGHLVSDGDEGEDKLEKGAKREGKTAWEVAKLYTEDFLEGMKKLGLITPEHITKATDYIPEQLELVRTLKEKGHTYQISDGIYFDISTFPSYTDFAGLNLDAQEAGARVEFNTEKRNPSDFALWKFSPEGQRRDMEWDTPEDLMDDGMRKKGFPGWHLECSAMAMNILGPTIDIHTGGIDHIPVHHTNEIAQSESASGVQFARYWLHNNHLKVDGTKISKSLGNGYTLQDLEQKDFDPLDFRLAILQSHYQSEANFTFESLESAKNRRLHWREVAALRWQAHGNNQNNDEFETVAGRTEAAIVSALSDNLNTPKVLQHIDEIFTRIEQTPLKSITTTSLEQLLTTIDTLTGLQLISTTPDIDSEAKELIARRQQARDTKDWATSDLLRDELLGRGIQVRDTASGTIWSYAK